MNHTIISLLTSVIIGGFIGWITNLIAIKALFHPQKPIRFLWYNWQGLIPKRQKELANNLGNMVEGELVNIPELVAKVKKEDIDSFIEQQVDSHKKDISDTIREYIENCIKRNQRLVDNISGVGRMFGLDINRHKENAIVGLTETACTELKKRAKSAAPKLLATASDEVIKHISVHDIAEEKVNTMDLNRLERMVNRIADKEMKLIEYLGGILGAIVGLLQWCALGLINGF